ncbi:MAG: autotransporter-associated beta strand repeat-containing protein [Verrucomicrobiota bacterium]
MKPRSFLAFSISTIVLGAAVTQANATDLYWDTNGSTAGIGGTGNWEPPLTNWSTVPAGNVVAIPWDNTTPSSNTAVFGGTAATVTLVGNVNVGGINFALTGYTLTGGTFNIAPASSPFVYTTNGGTSTLNSTITSANGTQIRKTGPGTLLLGNGGGGVSAPALYTVTGGTLNTATGIFDSIFAMPAGNRLGFQAASPTTVLTLDAGTFQVTSATGNALAINRAVLVNPAGGSIVDFGNGNFYEPSIVNNAGVGSSLYLTNGSGTTDFRGVISGPGSVTWSGAAVTNIVSFKAANTYTGDTVVNTGTLRLDFTNTNTGASRLSSSTAVKLNGATFSVLGTATAAQTTSQTINGLTISGACFVTDTVGAAGLTSTLALGNITRTNFGTLSFTLPATGNITSTKINTGGIIGGWATVGGTTWAATTSDGITPANITAYSSYLTTTVAGDTAANYLTTSNVDVTSTQTLSDAVSINTLRYNSAAANTLNLTGTNILAAGGILATTNVGANASAINGGTLQGPAGGDLIVTQNNTLGALTIGSLVADNTSASSLTKSGAGTLILNNTNSYTGGTTLAAGTLGVGQNGAVGSGGLNFTSNATLQASGANVSLSNAITLGLTSNVFDTNGNTLTLTGDISNSGAVNNPIKAAGTGTLVLAGSLNVTGSAGNTDNPALMLGNRNGANFNRGTVTLTGTGNISRISTAWDSTANTFNFASTGTVTMATDFVSGQSANGVGVLNFMSGTLNLQNLNMANWDGSYGAFTMTGGTINTANLRNGGNGNGNGHSYSLMTGGVVNISTTATIGRNGNGTNVLQIKGPDAQFNVGGGRLNVGFSGDSTGVVTVDSGLLTVNSNLSLAEGNTASTFGILNLNGGIVKPNNIVAGSAGGNSIVNFNGGTLQASFSTATFMGGLTGANIFSGGAVIDPNGTSITISQALKPAAGNGVDGITLSTGGVGYLGAPVVKITGGNGTGATAVAVVSGGVVTDILITSRGTGYTSAPTVTLVGGGATTAATVGTASITANAADGGLTRLGFGALTLTGASTYTGTTTVTDGMLATNLLAANGVASGIGAGTTVALEGGTFRYTGAPNNNGFNRTFTIGANGGTLDNSGGGFIFHGGSFTGSGTLYFIDSTNNSRQWLITGSSPGFSGDVYVGNGSPGSGMIQYRSNNPNPFGTGVITVNGGIVSADDGATIPATLGNNFILNGGFLGTQVSNMTYTGTVELMSNSSIGHPFTNTPGTVTMSGVISGDSLATLTIATGSSVTLSNTNTYQGPTDVFSGKLIVNGSLAVESAVTVAAAGTLGGTGTVNGTVTTVDATSVIAPGAGGIGTLTTGTTTLTGILAVELEAATSDKLNVVGDLDVTGATAVFTPLATPAAAKYVIVKYSGTLYGTMVSSTLPAGYSLTHDTAAKEIYVSNTGGNFSTYMNGFAGLTAGQKLPGADPDNDGISNLLEYALAGFNPTVPNVSPGTLTGNVLSFTKNPVAVNNNDITYAIQESTTLGVAPSPWITVTPLLNDGTTISYSLLPGLPREFARLKVSQN